MHHLAVRRPHAQRRVYGNATKGATITHFAGLNVSIDGTGICVVDGKGAVLVREQVATDPATIAQAFAPWVAELRRVNQVRAILFDRGIIIATGRLKLERWLRENLVAIPGLTPRMCTLMAELGDELRGLDARIVRLDREFEALWQADRAAVLLRTVPGIGALNATAMSAAVGDVSTFGKARDFSAWPGLVPRQITTGGKPRLAEISKRGSTYMRVPLIHGARSALPGLAKTDTPIGVWLRALLARAKRNVVVVALANKLPRIAWAILSSGRPFGPATAAAM
jgi:transposase